MSPEDHHAQVRQRTSDIVRLVVAAHRSDDRMEVAFELIGVAMLVCVDDEASKSDLAWFMRRCAERLDRDVTGATLQ